MLSIVAHVAEPCIKQNASRILADVYRKHHGIAGSHVAKSEGRIATEVVQSHYRLYNIVYRSLKAI